MAAKERCDLTDLVKNQCAHCQGHKSSDEEEDDIGREMVSNLLRFNTAKSERKV